MIPDIIKAEDIQTDCFACHEAATVESLPFLDDKPIVKNGDVLMYAANMATRKKTESVGKLAIGIRDENITSENLGYIMFHYWKNEDATLYRVSTNPRIVNKQDIPDGYLLRMAANSKKFLLLEYDPSRPVDIGAYDIMKVQRKGKGRYMPFVVERSAL